MKINADLRSQFADFVARGAMFVVNNSGGKDSQAMLALVRALVPKTQIVVIHAELPGVEWKDTLEHAKAMSDGLPFRVVRARKTFLGMVESTGRFPSPTHRQCTSDLKRGPIEKEIRRLIKEWGRSPLVVNCMGLRAEESDQRACGLDKAAYKASKKATLLKLNTRNSKAGREWYDCLPIHDYTIQDVWGTIAAAGQKPHWAYGAGATRLSCCFCIMGSKGDLRLAAKHNPALLDEIATLEQKIGKTMFAKKTIREHIGV